MRIRWKIAQAAEIRWWQNYLRKKNPTDYKIWKSQYWCDFLAKCKLPKPQEGIRCLDAGCGPAGIFMILDQQVVDAIDPLISEYESKIEAFSKDAYPWVEFHNLPIESFEAKSPYSLVFCLNAINHVSDWSASIQKLMAWTAPGGKLILSTDVHRRKWLKPIFRAIPGDILHPHQHSLGEYITELEKYQPKEIRKILIKREAIFDYWALVIEK